MLGLTHEKATLEQLALEHLARLVAFDTANPPRCIGTDDGVVEYARDVLAGAGFEVSVVDHGEGQVTLLAVRGVPELLFNVHLDTVPPVRGWSGDPHVLRVDEQRVTGLGACDVKGAAACLLAAAQRSEGPAALLLTTDEEAGSSRCVRAFLEREVQRFRAVVVSEPTGCRAVTAHRGVGSYELDFEGRAGHASGRNAAEASALHRAVRWAHAALDHAQAGPEDLRLNIGVFEGGTKANVAAESARVVFGMRPWSAKQGAVAVEALRALPPADRYATWRVRFEAPPLAAEAKAAALATRLGLVTASPVDFWTEGALFAEAGLTTIVYGPGSIEQAHAADEWIALAQLREATETFTRLLCGAPVGARR